MITGALKIIVSCRNPPQLPTGCLALILIEWFIKSKANIHGEEAHYLLLQPFKDGRHPCRTVGEETRDRGLAEDDVHPYFMMNIPGKSSNGGKGTWRDHY